MAISVLLAHPEPKSFNHAIANVVCLTLVRCEHRVFFHDLYMEGLSR